MLGDPEGGTVAVGGARRGGDVDLGIKTPIEVYDTEPGNAFIDAGGDYVLEVAVEGLGG